MNRILIYFLLISSFFACVPQQDFSHDAVFPTYLTPSQLGSNWKATILETGPLDFDLPEYEVWQIKGDHQDSEVYYKSNHELPLVSVSLFFPYGSYLASQQGKALVLEALSQQIRIGGTKKYTPDKFNQLVENLASTISFSYEEELVKISFNCLTQNLEETLKLFVQFLHYPRFDTVQLANWRLRKSKSISTRKDSPEMIARVTMKQLLNDGSHLATISTQADVENIFQQDLHLLHQNILSQRPLAISIVGDVKEGRAKRLASQLINSNRWKAYQGFDEELLPVSFNERPGIYFIEGDYSQSTIYLWQHGPSRLSPNHYNIKVFNQIFGTNGLTSKLAKVIRKEQGLVYGIYGATREDLLNGKSFIFMQTKAESTVEAIESSYQVIQSMQQDKVADHEIAAIKRDIENSFIFNYVDDASVVNQQISLKYKKFPKNYLETYINNIAKITAEDVQKVANEYWQTDQLKLLVVGAASAYTQLKEATEAKDSPLYKQDIYKVKFDEIAEL